MSKQNNVSNTSSSALLDRRMFVGIAGAAAVGFAAAGSLSQIMSVAHASESTSGADETVEFGTYPQTESGETAPIEWNVLKVFEDGSQLLVSKFGLDCVPYNEEGGDVTWETCSLRAWLNSDFIDAAFTEEEQGRIVATQVSNGSNPDYGTDGGADTEDLVFLLSQSEVEEYFGVARDGETHEELVVCPTDYAVAQGARPVESTGGGDWSLRSPGYWQNYAAYVTACGMVIAGGYDSVHNDGAIRAALVISA